MPDTADLINAMLDRLPPEVRADLAVNEIVAAAVLAGQASLETAARPVQVQRVDEYVSEGVVKTTWEVTDRRLPKHERIVYTTDREDDARGWAAVHAPISGGAYVYAAVDTDEPWHDTDAEQMGNANLYGVIFGCGVTEDAANMTADLAQGEIIHNGARVAVTATTDAWTLVSDGSNERWSAGCISSAGAAVLVSGDAAASSSVEPSKPEIGDRVLVRFWKIQAGQTIAANCEYKLDKRNMTPDPSFGAQWFVETSALKGFWSLGPAAGGGTVATASNVGLGCSIVLEATGAVSASTTTGHANGWAAVGTGAADGAGFIGPRTLYTHDWTMVWRGVLSSGTNQNVIIGAQASATVFTDANNMIGFRVSGTGTLQGICDSAGTETARDTSFTPDGTTEITLRIEVRGGGTIVRFFKDNAQVGADVTTNIPTTNPLYMACGIRETATADRRINAVHDWLGWREIGNA